LNVSDSAALPSGSTGHQNLGLGKTITAALLAWLIPGAGHMFLKRSGRGLFFAALIFISLGIGYRLEGNLYRPIPGQPLTRLATVGAMGVGVPYFVLRAGLGYHGDLRAPGFEYGTAFLLTAGLLNLLLVLDAWDIASGKKD
jgi:hypothetical protein